MGSEEPQTGPARQVCRPAARAQNALLRELKENKSRA